MSKVFKVSIALTPHHNEVIGKAIASGAYASTSEVIREALRDWGQKQEERKALIKKYRKLVQEGIDSGPGRFNSMDDIITEAKRGFAPRKKSA